MSCNTPSVFLGIPEVHKPFVDTNSNSQKLSCDIKFWSLMIYHNKALFYFSKHCCISKQLSVLHTIFLHCLCCQAAFFVNFNALSQVKTDTSYWNEPAHQIWFGFITCFKSCSFVDMFGVCVCAHYLLPSRSHRATLQLISTVSLWVVLCVVVPSLLNLTIIIVG